MQKLNLALDLDKVAEPTQEAATQEAEVQEQQNDGRPVDIVIVDLNNREIK